MSWFKYKDQDRRRYRVGIWLRTRSLPPSLIKQARKWMRKKEWPSHVIVKELQPDNYVILEFWCRNPFADWNKDPRYTVFHLRVKENDDWTCEGDLGRGLVEKGKRTRRTT